jgi:endonuclease YncB( thermonuclease family)
MVWVVLTAGLALAGCQSAGTAAAPQVRPAATQTPARAPEAGRPTVLTPVRPSPPAAAPLLYAAPGGDGDSWHDTHGREYRLGLVNTPEYNECYGGVATAQRKAMVAGGFRAAVYSTDVYGRRVAVVTTAEGVNLNVYLARHGYANDRYLATFRHENPGLAAQLDVAFAAARREHAGLWAACGR